jgi:hypothetical protein
MAYSSQGTTNPLLSTGYQNNIQIDNRTLIDRAYGALKLRPQQITGEMIQIALDMMNLVQLDMLNDAAPLWTLKKWVTPLTQGQQQYVLPPATNDVRSAFYRTMSNLTTNTTITQSSASYQWTFTQATQVTTIALSWPSASIPISVQTSPDNINWTTVYSSSTVDNGVTGSVAYDIDNANTAQYWRVIPATVQNGVTITPANTLPLTLSGQVYNSPQDVLMYRMNFDDYANLTTKTFQGRPLQFWLDRKIVPQMDLWPAPDATAAQNFMVVWRQRMISDVGSLQNTIECAPRWYFAFFYRLAAELAFCTPEVDPDVTAQIQAKADTHWKRAWNEERDKSPVKFQTNLRIYTR